MQRIVLISMYLGWGGVGRRVLELANAFAKRGNAILVITFNCRENRLDQKLADGVEVVYVPRIRLSHFPPRPAPSLALFNVLSTIVYRRVALQFEPTYVESQQYHAALLSFLRKGEVVVTNHGSIRSVAPYSESVFYRALSRVYGYFESTESQIAPAVIAVSDFVKKELQSNYGLEDSSVCVVPNGVNRDIFKVRIPYAERSRETFRMVTVSTFTRLKNVELQVQVAKIIGGSIDKWQWTIVGWGPAENRLRTAILSEGLQEHVRFCDFLPAEDLALLLNDSHVLLHTSLYESFGMALLEALACGTPVVALGSGAIPEVVGASPFLVPPTEKNRARKLAEAIIELYRNPELALHLSSMGEARSGDFAWDRIAVEYLGLIQDLHDQTQQPR